MVGTACILVRPSVFKSLPPLLSLASYSGAGSVGGRLRTSRLSPPTDLPSLPTASFLSASLVLSRSFSILPS